MDSTRPPEIVVDNADACHDGAAARGALGAALALARAPDDAWQVRVAFTGGGKRVTATAAVKDESGATVATRSLSSDGADCVAASRGIAVWVSLVLDASVERATHTMLMTATVTPPPPLEETRAAAAAPAESPPEADLFLRHPRGERTVELGLESFVMGGTGGGAIVGPAAYGIFEAAHGFFLRPTLMGGHSLGGLSRSAEAPATFLGSRFDACGRIPGMYREQLGLQLDFCLGGEVGFSRLDAGVAASVGVGTSTSPTIPFVGVGPSVGLRGELGNRLSAVVRGVADLSLLRDPVALAGGTTMTPAVLVARAEVGLSWSLR